MPRLSPVKPQRTLTIRQPRATQQPNAVRQVQHQEELELPRPDFADDLLKLNSPTEGKRVFAPSPGDTLGPDLNSAPARKDRFRFTDQTPARTPVPTPAQPSSQTKEVQANPPIDFDFQLPTDSEPETGQAEAESPAVAPLQPIPATEPDDIGSSISGELDPLDTPPPIFDAGEAEPEPFPFPNEIENPLMNFGDGTNGRTSDDEEESIDLSATRGRDCEAQAKSCQIDFAYLAHRERTNMSLDITPSIRPSEVDMAKVEETRVEKLADAPTRTWTDIEGRVIADGVFEDYRDGKVFVRTVNGSLRPIPHHTLSDSDRCFVAAWWELPAECNFESERYVMRDFRLTTFTWAASASCHKPLYFEQVGVERYGHSSGPIVQPIVSGAHFFGSIVMLPYKAGLHPPNECLYTLGHYRPGDCAPWLVPGFPFTTRGFRWEGLALGAAIALLP